MIYTLQKDYYGHSFKVGSTWTFRFTRKAGDPAVAVDITGLTSRVMFRADSVDGDVAKTVEDADITNGGDEGTIEFPISATDSALFTAGIWYFFDIEMTAIDDNVWQSPTFKFQTEQEVTRS